MISDELKKHIDSAINSRLSQMLLNAEDKMKRYLSEMAAEEKFSQFNNASLPYNGTEKWVGLQNGDNVQGNISDLTPEGVFTPSIVLMSNLTSASGVTNGGKYSGNKIITVVNKILVQTDGSGAECKITIQPPIPTNFTDIIQAEILGLPSIVLSTNETSSGNTGSGWDGVLRANTSTNNIDFYFECSQINAEYILTFSYIYVLQ